MKDRSRQAGIESTRRAAPAAQDEDGSAAAPCLDSVRPPCYVRPALAAEVAVLEALDREIFPPGWPLQSWREVLAERPVRAWVVSPPAGARASCAPYAGFALAEIVDLEAEILKIGVNVRFRSHGLATALLQHVLAALHSDGVQQVHLEVRATNRVARRLYEKESFREVGKRHSYYADGEDALLFCHTLSDLPDL